MKRKGVLPWPSQKKPLYYLSIHEAQQLIKDRQLSPVDLTQAVLERIHAVDGKLHAYINLMADSALREASAAEAEIAKGNWRGPMHGIPIAVKDQLDVEARRRGIRQFTKGVGDATAVRKLREAGAIMMGKLHMSSLPDAELPIPRNPWNTEHITGGSSTGSGARVGRRFVPGFSRRRHRGLDSQSVGILRSRRFESDLWAG
mgnify:CR=1 FL=1